MRKPSPQLALFDSVPQPRPRDPESWELWLAVLDIRKRGHRVYRAGRRAHSVDGRIVRSAKHVIALAEVGA